MSVCDPIADMLTRIRNAYMAGHDVVALPHSKLKAEIARILKKEGYLADYVVEGAKRKEIRLYLKYIGERQPAITGIERRSRPGLRVYANADETPRVLGGMGIAIMSTPQGVMTAADAKKQRVGGEIVCAVW